MPDGSIHCGRSELPLMASRTSDQSPSCRTPPELAPKQLLQVPCDVADSAPVPQWLLPGTTVIAGQALLTAPSQSHATPVAPVAGRVGAPTVVRLIGGQRVHAIELQPDSGANDSPAVPIDPSNGAAAAPKLARITPTDLADWLTRIERSGIWASRWTCPDLLGQLRDALSRPVDTLLCNLLDSDPWLPIARVVASTWPLELATGLGLLGRLAGASNWWALTDQADDVGGPLRRAAATVAGQLRIAPTENDYPQLDPTLLVHSTTGRRLRPGRRPTSLGVLLVDAPAAVAIGRLFLAGLTDAHAPMTHVPVVLYDQAGDAIHAFRVAPGTTVGSLAKEIALPSAVREIYAGGPLRQSRVSDDDVVGGGELTLFASPPQPVVVPSPCVRCGWCIETCPTRCRPAGLLQASQLQDADLARREGLDACIECGLCNFVCPSRLPLLEGIRQIRREIAAEA